MSELDVRIYLCALCGGPIIFRQPGHRLYHVGTGWPCWKEHGGGGKRAQPDVVMRSVRRTPLAERKQLREQAAKLLDAHAANEKDAPVLRFFTTQMRAGRYDVAGEVLVGLGNQSGRASSRLLRRILQTESWQTFAQSAAPSGKGARQGGHPSGGSS